MRALVAAMLLGASGLPAASETVALVGGTLIDGTGAPAIPGAVVLVKEGRIAAAGPAASVAIPPEARRVDCAGRWILPGLVDMHVHMDEVISPEAFLLFGVTTVRDVGSRLVTIQRLRARTAKGRPTPRVVWMGRNIDGGAPSWWGAVAVRSAAGVPALLDDMARQGVDGVKLYVRAGPKVAAAVIREAHRRGWPVTGHLEATAPSRAAALGIDNLEHIHTLFHELAPPRARRTTGFACTFGAAGGVDLDGPAARQLIRTLARRHAAVTPTLVSAILPVEGEAAADRLYAGWTPIPPGWRRLWRSAYWDFMKPRGWSGRDYRVARAAARQFSRIVVRLHRAGAPIVAGTDTPAPWVLPGAGLIRELELYVAAGMTPLEAIRSATGRAAAVLRREGEVGTVRTGCRADLLILDADPLRSIRHLRRVASVWLDGRPVDLELAHRAFLRSRPPPGKGG